MCVCESESFDWECMEISFVNNKLSCDAQELAKFKVGTEFSERIKQVRYFLVVSTYLYLYAVCLVIVFAVAFRADRRIASPCLPYSTLLSLRTAASSWLYTSRYERSGVYWDPPVFTIKEMVILFEQPCAILKAKDSTDDYKYIGNTGFTCAICLDKQQSTIPLWSVSNFMWNLTSLISFVSGKISEHVAFPLFYFSFSVTHFSRSSGEKAIAMMSNS